MSRGETGTQADTEAGIERGKSRLNLERGQAIMLACAAAASVLAGILSAVSANAVLIFVIAGVALALLAALVGEATDQVGARLGPGATGVLQSALGNLPELFVGIFALRAGLLEVVQAALVGSILGNSLFVLGLAFLVGGLRHGTQRFNSDTPRMIATLTLLAVAALVIPTLTLGLHTPAAGHEEGLSIACAIILLLVFLASIPVSLKGGPASVSTGKLAPADVRDLWPVWLAIVVLVGAGIGSAFVSDWFIAALTPAINSLHIALGLIPVLVLLSFVIGGVHLTLVLAPLLVAALGLTAILSTVIIYDGESNWLEGLALIGQFDSPS